MANKYIATNVLTGETLEGSAEELSIKLLTNGTQIYNASSSKKMIDGKWKVILASQIIYIKQCLNCECEFKTTFKQQIYCSDKCRNMKMKKPKSYTSKKTEGYKKRHKSLADVATQARNAGMTYGQYVAKMGL